MDQQIQEGSLDNFLITKPGVPTKITKNYEQKLKKSMSTKISDSISNLDVILTNKKRPKSTVKGVSRLFNYSKANINTNHGNASSIRLKSAMNTRSINRDDDIPSVTNYDSQDIGAHAYIEQIHGDESEYGQDLDYFNQTYK